MVVPVCGAAPRTPKAGLVVSGQGFGAGSGRSETGSVGSSGVDLNQPSTSLDFGFSSAEASHALRGVVILGGGTGERLGGVSKPELVVAGKSLLQWSLLQLPAVPTVLVAPETVPVPPGVGCLMEDPPRSGPAAGFAAGVTYLSEAGAFKDFEDYSLVALLPVDAPLAGRCLPVLEQVLGSAPDLDCVLAEADGVRQNVLSVFRLSALREAFSQGVTNTSMRRVLGRLRVGCAQVESDWVRDADTATDIADLEVILARS